jgi:pimeloyl-ACP methyl ester carboxylesterase
VQPTSGPPRPEHVRLRDGRTLAFREYGDRTGAPCVYIPGTPVSSLAGQAYDDAARRAGVRLICMDKPGYGHSDPHPAGTLISSARDVEELADSLALGRFAVAGESGGGPYALAVGHVLPHRLTISTVLVGMGPGHEAWARQGMKPLNLTLLFAAQRAPWALRPLLLWYARSLARERPDAHLGARHDARLPEADNEVNRRVGHIELASTRDAFRQGISGMLREAQLLAAPWGFDLSQVHVHVELWHGEADMNVPVTLARHVAERLPDCTAHILPAVGHAAGHVAEDAWLGKVAEAAQATS